MSRLLRTNVLIITIGTGNPANFIKTIVPMEPSGSIPHARPQVHASKAIIKIKKDIVEHYLRHVYLRPYGMATSAKHMEVVPLEPTWVEIVARAMFHARMAISGIASDSLVTVLMESNRMDIAVCNALVARNGSMGSDADVLKVILIWVPNVNR